MKIKEYIIINTNRKVIFRCVNLKDVVECYHKLNKTHIDYKILKIMAKEKNES